MNQVGTDKTATLEAWIARVQATPWDRSALERHLDGFRDVLKARFGEAVTLERVDEVAGPAPGPHDHASRWLEVAGERRARLSLCRHADTAALADLDHTVTLAGRLLSDVERNWANEELAVLWDLLGSAVDAEEPAEHLDVALERLRHAIDVELVGLFEFRAGAFVPYAVAHLSEGARLAATIGGVLDPRSASDRTFTDGKARFIEHAFEIALERADPPADEARLGAVAIVPFPKEPHAHLQLVAAESTTRAWRKVDRTLLDGAGRALHLFRDQQRQVDFLRRIFDLERTLLGRIDGTPMQLILEELVELVPGAEAGTLLLRDGDVYRFDGIVGYEPETLERVTIDVDAMVRWYEDGRAGGSLARLLRAPEGIAAASRRASGDRVGSSLDLDRILANLTLPIEHEGRWSAVVNLDAFASEHAFAESDRRLLESFAPIVGFALLEGDIRRELRRYASYDELTGLLNRRAFNVTLRQELRRSSRTETGLALMVMDLDDFKRLNDEFGHAAGDDGLRAVAQVLRATLRESDHIFRWGGDEFAAILPDTDHGGADRMVERLVEAVDGLDLNGHRLGMSIGVAVHAPNDKTSIDELMTRADDAMYAAKRRADR